MEQGPWQVHRAQAPDHRVPKGLDQGQRQVHSAEDAGQALSPRLVAQEWQVLSTQATGNTADQEAPDPEADDQAEASDNAEADPQEAAEQGSHADAGHRKGDDAGSKPQASLV